MKIKKLLVGLVVAVLVSIVPASTMSKESNKDTVVLSADNVIVLNDAVTSDSVSKVIAKAKELDAKESLISKVKGKKPIYLFLNTPGGSIQSGLELVEALEGLGRPVHTITLFAASMGFQIAQHLGDRLILKNGVLMSHRAYGSFEGSFGGQSPSQMESRYGLWMKRLKEMDEQTVKRTKGKQTLESYQKSYADELWMTGSESVVGGYADRIVTAKCDSSLTGTTQNELSFFGMRITYELDNCPLNTGPTNVKIGFTTTRGVMNADQFVNAGGSFGPACLIAKDDNKVCALDTSLNLDKIEEVKRKFRDQYENKKSHVMPMSW